MLAASVKVATDSDSVCQLTVRIQVSFLLLKKQQTFGTKFAADLFDL